MKKIILIFLFVLILCICLFNGYGKRFFNDDMDVFYSINNILIDQEDINLEIKEFVDSNKYTIENPKVIVNPYRISPLTALVIFNTDKEVIIDVNINDEYVFKTEKSSEHIIPIYGLYEDNTNLINLSIDDKIVKKIEIITDKAVNVNSFDVISSKYVDSTDLYFMTSPVGTSASAYDVAGNLKWYFTEKFTMDFEWLDNGHFLVGISDGDVADRKIGFVEIDYLGKIYNYYVLENGYEFEFQLLNNGNYMLCGGDRAIYYDKAWIYEIDKTNGEVVSYVDLYDIFKGIDSDFDDSLLNFRIIRNAFYYNEDTGELLVSLRGLNSIVSIDYKTKKINYIFAPDGIYSEKFDEYMVTLESGRFPLGQHSVFMTKDGYVGFINNGYDRFNGFEVGGIDTVSNYSNSYSSAEIYEIKNKIATLVWNFDANKKYFTHQYGSFNMYGNNKLVNFGWTLHDEYRKRNDATLSESEKNTDNTYARIYEINEDDEIIFEGIIEDGKYRVFKHSIYENEINNFDYSLAKFYNTMSLSKKEVIFTRNIKDELNNAYTFDNNIKISKYSIETDFVFDKYDQVDLLLVGKNNFSYKFNYKEELGNVKKNLNMQLGKGDYALYLVVNGVYFNTNVKVIY